MGGGLSELSAPSETPPCPPGEDTAALSLPLFRDS